MLVSLKLELLPCLSRLCVMALLYDTTAEAKGSLHFKQT